MLLGWGSSAWSPPRSQLNSPFGSQPLPPSSAFDFRLPQDSPLSRPTKSLLVEQSLAAIKASGSSNLDFSQPVASPPANEEDTTMTKAKTPPPLPEDETMDVDSPPPTRRIVKTLKPAPNPVFEDSVPDNDDTIVIDSPRLLRGRKKSKDNKPRPRPIIKTGPPKGKDKEASVPATKKRKIHAVEDERNDEAPEMPDAHRGRGRGKGEPPHPSRGISGGGFGERVPEGMEEVPNPRSALGVLVLSRDFGKYVEVDGRLWAADIAPFVVEEYSYPCDQCKKAGTHCRALQRSGCICARCVYTKGLCTFNGKKLLRPRIPYRPDPVQYDAIVAARNLINQHMDAISRIIRDIFLASNLQEHVSGLWDCVNSLWGVEALAKVMDGVEGGETSGIEEVEENEAGPSTV
ncbi:uncharacterized protein EV420DRAFT_1615724 [Desarmillaria tabescens]|uniref:Uncharacterized protein n=1 Tax=Armillaria tabescens TaxID=1929756 RepID=A0AA39MCU6_ARMTA|nr:uncharacterized protein EV420DRAFT_1615724 [Desarmillaria tabescens]KAK0430141.1 hypothetical protein EV420DRAFT_1615724 [Desarmillaria tabescens]